MTVHLGELFRRNAEVVPGAVAAAMGGRRITHAELDDAANRVAARLRALGVGRGDRVVCWMKSGLDVLPIFAAATKLGAVFAPLSTSLGPDEALPFVRHARPVLVVAERPIEGADAPFEPPAALLAAPPARDVVCAGARDGDPHVLFFTSGSTGRPKGVIVSHRANHLRTYQGVFRDDAEHSVCMFPLFHMAAYTLALSAWQTGGSITFAGAGAAELLDAVVAARANRLYGIPAVWARILELLDREPGARDLSSLCAVDTGTSATPVELLRALKERFPWARARVYYGSTEAGACTALADADLLARPGSVGRPVAGVRVRVSAGGELEVKSPLLFDGYFDDADATAAAFDDGWYRTGDRAAIDGDGYVSIVGRLTDLIRTGGEAVAPAEVEAVLRAHPAIADVAVVGVPDPRWGEIVCAVAVADPGAPRPDLDELQGFCAARLAGFKKPRRLEWTAALPRTAATGQVQRALIVQQLLAR